MSEALVQPIGVALFFALLLVALLIAHRVQKKQDEKCAKDRREKIAIGVEKGVCNEDGEPLCVVCKEIATHYMPVTDRMLIDKLPGLKMLNDLTAMPWRYNIADDYTSGFKLCGRHRSTAERRLKEVHAGLRADHAKFNARQHERLELLDRGGLEKLLQNDEGLIQRQLGLVHSMRGTLQDPTSTGMDVLHVLPGRSSSADFIEGSDD